ncbi:MAG: PDZ domain-containing protein [Planctomycetales bacterium]
MHRPAYWFIAVLAVVGLAGIGGFAWMTFQVGGFDPAGGPFGMAFEPEERGYLGVDYGPVTGAGALTNLSGVEVTAVIPGSPADQAGIEVGDVIVSLDGMEVLNVGHMRAISAKWQPDEPVLVGLRPGNRPEHEARPVRLVSYAELERLRAALRGAPQEARETAAEE